MLAQLMREAVGVKLDPDHIPDREGLENATSETVVANGVVSFAGKDATVARQRASACFEETFDAWLDRVYSDSTLTANAAQVQATLTLLRTPGATPTDEMLADFAARIDVLAVQVETADHGWAGARGKELVPGLTAMYDTARHLRLIGEAPVQAVLAHQQAEQNAFAARWLVHGNLPSVLSASPASGMQLAADLPPLRDALRTLVKDHFAILKVGPGLTFAMREGKKPDGADVHEFMPWKIFRSMTDEELSAIWLYLKSVPPKPFGNK